MRKQFIADALDINIVQASIINEMISDIPDNKLAEFFAFRVNYIEPMMSKELITKRALFDYRRKQYECGIKSGTFAFESREQLKEYIQTYYKGKDLGNGLGKFYDYVVIAVDSDGNFINKFVVDEYTGKYKKLSCEDVADVIDNLFEEQQLIGDVKYVPYHEDRPTQYLENKSEPCDIHNGVRKLIEKVIR